MNDHLVTDPLGHQRNEVSNLGRTKTHIKTARSPTGRRELSIPIIGGKGNPILRRVNTVNPVYMPM